MSFQYDAADEVHPGRDAMLACQISSVEMPVGGALRGAIEPDSLPAVGLQRPAVRR